VSGLGEAGRGHLPGPLRSTGFAGGGAGLPCRGCLPRRRSGGGQSRREGVRHVPQRGARASPSASPPDRPGRGRIPGGACRVRGDVAASTTRCPASRDVDCCPLALAGAPSGTTQLLAASITQRSLSVVGRAGRTVREGGREASRRGLARKPGVLVEPTEAGSCLPDWVPVPLGDRGVSREGPSPSASTQATGPAAVIV
jgi:hypothetical protein